MDCFLLFVDCISFGFFVWRGGDRKRERGKKEGGVVGLGGRGECICVVYDLEVLVSVFNGCLFLNWEGILSFMLSRVD